MFFVTKMVQSADFPAIHRLPVLVVAGELVVGNVCVISELGKGGHGFSNTTGYVLYQEIDIDLIASLFLSKSTSMSIVCDYSDSCSPLVRKVW